MSHFWASAAFRACPLIALCLNGALATDPAELKITRVALFSSGVGFFECEATVTDSATAELKFRTDQVNDILKSLVVQDLDGGTVSAVGYASRDPIEKTLKSFAVDVTGNPSLGQLLGGLRGEPVEIAGPRQIKGVIVGVEKHRIAVEKNTIEVDMLNVLTETGLEQMRLSEVQGLNLTNEKINAELRKALATLATSHDADKKTVVVRFDGEGKRRVRASYLLEAPIWKTSYRLVLSPEKKPFLQGWATVENATEGDWPGVSLSLVSGRPISFTMDLYTPIYVSRPHEELELYASLRPPQYAAGFGGAAVATGKPAAAVRAASVARSRDGGRVAGDRAGEEALDAVLAETAAPAAAPAFGERLARGNFGRRGVESVASAKEAGELFEYAIATPVSIARQRSAMLPIVNQEIAGEKVSIYNPATHAKHPLNGLQMENTTALNLMQGPVTVFDSGVYAGDAKLPDLRPGEKRLISYALDLAVEVMVRQQPQPDELVSLRIVKGTLIHRHKYVDDRTYVIRNKDKKDRVVLLEQPYGDDWQLVEPKEPFERAPNLSRFKVAVAAGQTVEQKIVVERIGDQSVALADTGFDVIEIFQKSRVISPKVKETLERVVAMRMELDRVGRERAAAEKATKEALDEQARVRANLQTLQQNTDAYQRQLKKFDALETQIEQARARTAELRRAEEESRRALQSFLVSIEVE